MITFIIGLVILIGGAALYGKFCERVFSRTTERRRLMRNRTVWTMSL